MKKLNNKGFSLVELIIVIAIMAVLVGVLAPQFIKYVESSRQSTDIDNVRAMKTAVESFVADASTSGKTVPATITITLSSTTASVDGDDVKAELDALGLTTGGSCKMKSAGWPGSSWTYSTSSFKWEPATGTTTGENSKEPKKKMVTVFSNSN